MDYIEELDKALTFIEEHLSDHLDLEMIAKQVSISSFHFHRIFKAVVKETVMDYVRTRRLTASLECLIKTDQRIIDVSLAYGFESQAAFTRAFKSYFGTTPGQARKSFKLRNHNGRPAFSVKVLKDLLLEERTMPEIVHLESIKLIGMNCLIDLQSNIEQDTVSKLWAKISNRVDEIDHRIKNTSYGVEKYPDSYGIENETFEYIAAFEVSEFGKVPEGMIAFELPERSYAVYRYKGLVGPETVTQIFANIYGQWILNLPYDLYCDYDFEYYDEHFNPENPDGYMRFYIPIKK